MRTITFAVYLCLAAPVCATEDFKGFLFKFFSEEKFQIARIEFPMQSISLSSPETGKRDTIYIKKNDWTFSDWEFFQQKYGIQTYDNFDRKLKETGNRVVEFFGTQSGENIALYFKVNKFKKWYLVRIVDESM